MSGIDRCMNRLKQHLSKNQIRQRAFAERCGVTQPTMSRLINGAAQPSVMLAKKIEEETGGAVRFYDWPAYAELAPHSHERGLAS